MGKEKYFYSEGYVYKGTDTICKLYGTNDEMQEIGDKIIIKLNGYCDSEMEQCPYCGSHIKPIKNADIIKAFGRRRERAVCGKTGCDRPKLDGNVYCSYHYDINIG